MYPAFEIYRKGASTSAWSGRALSRNYEVLEAMAGTLDVTPLSKFIDNRSMLEMLIGSEDDLITDWPETVWFAAQDGIETARSLRNHLPNCADLPYAEEIAQDLLELEQVLAIAAQNNIRFHLLVDV